MKFELSPLRQRWLAAGILGAIVLAAALFVLWPMWTAWALHAERVDMLKRQARTMEGLAEAAPRLEAAAKKLGDNPDARLLTFAAPQPTLAVAQLQSQIGQLMSSVSATVMSSQVLPEARDGALTKISVQTMIEADVKALIKALHGVEGARPLLRVEKLVVRDPDGDWNVAPQTNAPNKLQVEIVISAFARAP